MPSNLQMNTNDNIETHSLIDMLERFVLVDTFKWSTSDQLLPMHLDTNSYQIGTSRYLKQYILPQAILDNSELHRQKLNNFLLLNSDVEIELKVNATPFQAGALLGAFFPRSLNTTKFRAEGNEFLAAVTTTPHRILHLEEGNSLRMTIPFANILDMLDLTQTNSTYGVFNVYALSPLSSTEAPSEIDVTVRMRFVNLKVSVATDRSIMTQQKYIDMEVAKHQAMASWIPPLVIPGAVAQSSEGDATGPVTRISSAIGTIADTLSGVPLIGKAASMVGWFARGVSGVASVFGWSKPTDNTMPAPILNKPACYMGNVEGKDASHVLAQINDNAIDTSSINPSNEDEMALSYITQRPNIIGRYTVTRANFKARKLLFSFEVSPWSSLMQQQHANGQDFALGGVSFACLMYRLWRGALDYNLMCVKTMYHSGRIIAVYFPNRTRLDVPATFTQEMTTNNHIIYDLAAKAEDENSLTMPFSVPYTSNEPWKRTLYKNINGLYDASTFNTHVGVVAVYCLNELVCPPSVSDSVTFLLQHKSGDGFQVAIPQIQIQGGFAIPEVPNDPSAELSGLINQEYSYDMDVPATLFGDTPDFTYNSGIVIDQQTAGTAKWIDVINDEIALADGDYDTTLNVSWSDPSFADGSVAFAFTVVDGRITTCTSSDFPAVAAIDTPITVSVATSPDFTSFNGLHAQSSDAASEDFTVSDPLAQGASHDVSRYTTGEYCKSLRPLLKRFVHTADINTNQAYTRQPIDFINYDTVTDPPLYPVGNRSWYLTDGDTNTGGLMPESWPNLISYLFRFYAGSARSKVFIPFNAQSTSSLDMVDTLTTQTGRPKTDPAFVQSGVINNAVECHIPYYGQYKARTIGDETRGTVAAQRLSVTGPQSTLNYYEASGDDASMWYLVGPPVMRPTDVNPVDVPILEFPASTQRVRQLRKASSQRSRQSEKNPNPFSANVWC